jgi:hypothetical protein
VERVDVAILPEQDQIGEPVYFARKPLERADTLARLVAGQHVRVHSLAFREVPQDLHWRAALHG